MRTLVLGVGNILLQDEGVGVQVVQELQRRFQPPAGVEFLDGGTTGMGLIEDIAGKDALIIVDAVQTGAPPGTLVRLDGDEVPAFLQQRLSPHQLGLCDVLALLTLLGQKPARLTLLGVTPQSMELSLTLSDVIKARALALVEQVAAELAAMGVPLTPVVEPTPV